MVTDPLAKSTERPLHEEATKEGGTRARARLQVARETYAVTQVLTFGLCGPGNAQTGLARPPLHRNLTLGDGIFQNGTIIFMRRFLYFGAQILGVINCLHRRRDGYRSPAAVVSSSVVAGQMAAVETRQMSAVETR